MHLLCFVLLTYMRSGLSYPRAHHTLLYDKNAPAASSAKAFGEYFTEKHQYFRYSTAG